jgi:hypothetical protein
MYSNTETGESAMDPHFYVLNSEEYEAIMFNLDSEDTKQFKAGINMDFEITVKLNTDGFASLNNKDSIIIEPQHSIAVVDSLYSHI